MSVSPTQEIIADIRAGKMVILVDEEDRENEGDLVIAAEHITPETINCRTTAARTVPLSRCRSRRPRV